MKYLFPFLFSFIAVASCSSEKKNSNSDEKQLAIDNTTKSINETPEVNYIEANSDFDSSTISDATLTIEETKPIEITEKSSEPDLNEVNTVKSIKDTVIETPPIVEKKIEIPVEVAPVVKAEIHKKWDDLTKKHISSSGTVDYAGFVKDKASINEYIKELQSYHKDLKSWNKNKRLAYWINVYNAVTVKLIVDNYPVKSIKDINGGKPWDKKLINLGGVDYTLNVIENKIIRPKFNEPRIHFAVNCAAKSCPKILNRAWTEDNLERYLTKQTKAFIANASQNSISADKLVLSNIFNWYKTDFGKTDAELIEFINKYSDTQVNANAAISFNEYDWKLNN